MTFGLFHLPSAQLVCVRDTAEELNEIRDTYVIAVNGTVFATIGKVGREETTREHYGTAWAFSRSGFPIDTAKVLDKIEFEVVEVTQDPNGFWRKSHAVD